MHSPINVKSEIGKLKTVVLHRPGEELEALAPEYMDRMLFDDVPFLKMAQEEHDAFAQVLRDNGVEVLYLEDLAAEALTSEELKWQFVREMVKASKQSERRSTEAIIDYLGNMDAKEMILKVMAGVKKKDIELPDNDNKELSHYMADDYPFYLDPMPNLYFTRDPAAAVGDGLAINKMHYPARRRESIFMKYIMNYHPRFKQAEIPIWFSRDNKFSIEGGDILVLDKDTVAIGISERTEPEAVETIATNLFAKSDFKRILAIEIPVKRAFMHLDTVFTMIDYDKFSVHPEAIKQGEKMNIYVMDKADTKSGYFITHETDIKKVLREALKLDEVTLIECGDGDLIAASREQWNDGSNTLALEPGVVVTYDRNHVTNDAMRRAGIKVIEVAGAELGRGRGGPRCMSMPIYREDL